MASNEERQLILEGILLKSPPEEKIKKNYKWHKRHMKLWTDCTLEYFKKKDDKTPLKEPIDLHTCLGIIETDSKYEKHFFKPFKYPFCLNMQHRQYHFVAVTEHERDQWRRAIADICGLGERLNRTQEEVQQILNNELPRRPSVSSAKSSRSNSQPSASSTPTTCRTSSAILNANLEPALQPAGSPILQKSERSDSLRSASGVESDFVDDSVLPRRTSLPENRAPIDIPDGLHSPYDQLPPPKPIANSPQPLPSKFQQERGNRPDYIDLILNKRSFDDYDTPPVNNEATYDTPPPISSSAMKQKRTDSPCDPMNDSGYIQMEGENNMFTGKTDFFPTNNRPIKRAESEKDTHFKQFRTVGRQQPKSQSLKPKTKLPPDLPLPHKHSTISSRPSIDDGPVFSSRVDDCPIFDEIPVMPSKHVKEIVNINGLNTPPSVDRCKKPVKPHSPVIDRSTKPKLIKQNSETPVRTPEDDLSSSLLNMSFDAARLHTLKLDDVYTNHTLNNNTSEEAEGNYFNHRINNAPFQRGFASSYQRGESFENNDPMGNYDNFKLQKTQQRQEKQQLPINFKKFYKPPLERQKHHARSFDDQFYDSLRPEYEQEALPAIPPFSTPPTAKRRSFSLDTDYTNFTPSTTAASSNNNITSSGSYVNSRGEEGHANVTVSPSRLGTHYVVTPATTFSEA